MKGRGAEGVLTDDGLGEVEEANTAQGGAAQGGAVEGGGGEGGHGVGVAGETVEGEALAAAQVGRGERDGSQLARDGGEEGGVEAGLLETAAEPRAEVVVADPGEQGDPDAEGGESQGEVGGGAGRHGDQASHVGNGLAGALGDELDQEGAHGEDLQGERSDGGEGEGGGGHEGGFLAGLRLEMRGVLRGEQASGPA